MVWSRLTAKWCLNMSVLSVEQIQKCRAKATELRERAAKLPESDVRQQLIEVAREWDASGC